jgi:hypothetical protein
MNGSNPDGGIARFSIAAMDTVPSTTGFPVSEDALLAQERPAPGETVFWCAALALILGTLIAVAFDAAYPDHRHAVALTKATMHTVFGGITALPVLFHLVTSLRKNGWQAVALRVLDVVAIESYLILLWTSWR